MLRFVRPAPGGQRPQRLVGSVGATTPSPHHMPISRTGAVLSASLATAAFTGALLLLPDPTAAPAEVAVAVESRGPSGPSQAELVPRHLRAGTTSTTSTSAAPPSSAPPPTAAAAPAAPPSSSPPAPAPPPPPPAPAPAAAPAALGGEEARLLDLINGERARAGLPALSTNAGATGLARDWSAHQASNGSLTHNPNLASDVSARVTPSWTSIGENVGVGSSVDQIHAGFMNSSAHRANVVGADFDLVGVGVVSSGGQLWVTVVFVGV